MNICGCFPQSRLCVSVKGLGGPRAPGDQEGLLFLINAESNFWIQLLDPATPGTSWGVPRKQKGSIISQFSSGSALELRSSVQNVCSGTTLQRKLTQPPYFSPDPNFMTINTDWIFQLSSLCTVTSCSYALAAADQASISWSLHVSILWNEMILELWSKHSSKRKEKKSRDEVCCDL